MTAVRRGGWRRSIASATAMPSTAGSLALHLHDHPVPRCAQHPDDFIEPFRIELLGEQDRFVDVCFEKFEAASHPRHLVTAVRVAAGRFPSLPAPSLHFRPHDAL